MKRKSKKPTLPSEVTVKCCDCSGSVTFVVPKSPKDYPTFFHTMPKCKRFDSTNTPDAIVKYLQDCNRVAQN